MKNYVNLNDMTLQECEHFKVEMEMKKNYYGAFMSNVLTDESSAADQTIADSRVAKSGRLVLMRCRKKLSDSLQWST